MGHNRSPGTHQTYSTYFSLQMQKLGQHFLKNKLALKLIVEALELKPDDAVIEIGSGHGELTEVIRGGGQKIIIIAIEKDERLFKELQVKFKNENNMEIIYGDALKLLKDPLDPSLLIPRPFKIIGNIPYYITGHLLRIISELKQKPERCVFTIQKEVAERIIAKPPHMNRLAASVQFWAEPKILKVLSARDFSPPPKVDSTIIGLDTRYPIPDTREQYYTAVRAIFAQPRKTVVNNLANAECRMPNAARNKEGVIKILEKIGIKPNARPQDLNIKDIAAVARVLF
jgi:16S rRNA (adenine1518-N6/adenine1519-N6)-dimethyltransferase